MSPLVLEARQPTLEAKEVYLRHRQPWFLGMLSQESVLKGGFIARCSDIDSHLYLADTAFEQDRCPP